MKILVLSDIHSNWPALSAVQESFDACLFAGDLVDYGTDPIPCIDWVRDHATAAVRGNHDHAVAQRIKPRSGSGFRDLAAATRPLHWKILQPSRTRYLAELPVTQLVTVGDASFFLVHGTPRDPLDEYLTDDSDAWLARLESVEADYVCVGHTHVPFHLDLGRIQVLNPGSVGQPRDGDPRCSYAIIENGRVEIHRVEYDINATLQQMEQSGLNADTLHLAESVLRNGGKRPDGMSFRD
jgi:putative phosphoesterase